MTERAIHVGLLIASLAVTGWVFGAQHPHPHPHTRDPSSVVPSHSGPAALLALIPPGSAFLLTADLQQLEHAPLGVLLAQRLGHLGGANQLASVCGFDPLARLDQLVLAVPSAGLAAQEHPEDFGIVASGQFTGAEITRCASAVIKQRGGDPVTSQLGSFASVRDRKTIGGELAARDGGPLIVSGGSYLRELIDAAEGNAAKPEREDTRATRHAELRRDLGSGSVLATWLLGEGWFERVSGDGNARLSPLSTLESVGARLDVDPSAQLSVLLECADSAGATRVSSLLNELRSSLDSLPLDPALSGVAKRITLSQSGARLKLALELSQAELKPLLDQLLGP